MISLQQTFETKHPVVLVTGSGKPRVGQTIAEHFASHGCRVVVHANQSRQQARCAADDLANQHGVETLVVTGDLTDDDLPSAMVSEVIAHFGRIDMLINSAAIWSSGPLEQVTADDMRRHFQINTVASAMLAREAGLRMTSQDAGGCIIQLGDWATCRPYLDHAAYFPSKGAVETMTRSLAVEFGRRHHRVRVNCVRPGPVLLDESVEPSVRRQLAASTLAGRIGTPDEVAHATRMLCENPFITGVCLSVDGGRGVFAPDGLQDGYNTG